MGVSDLLGLYIQIKRRERNDTRLLTLDELILFYKLDDEMFFKKCLYFVDVHTIFVCIRCTFLKAFQKISLL